ncbi:hypothetical protein [Thermoflexus sp.]|uniref:hypothetical protein n=1 Tax=Thermoflexus sp. TaxID=1969742 RepID=UPI0025FD1699|nr:hypothetical protein [Thermoflexus sp.]MCS6963993.1 hypothetical protein [Thermoflexus sp.]MCX7691359.1 hypothetical protein [Thermoflexus sp.]MDW8065469.1 hypothetical protein [Anaerolineae bacterium]
MNRAISRFLEGQPTRLWREPAPTALPSRIALQRQRPWLAFYDEGVLPTIVIPHVPLHNLLRSSARRFPRRFAIYFENACYCFVQL